MEPRDRVRAALARGAFDRLPIKHLAVAEVDRRLSEHFCLRHEADLLDRLGHDFREIRPVYRGPDFGPMDSEHGIISGSAAEFIPTLIADGLDVLDVVQTSAAGMDLAELKRRFGSELAFAGTFCVQHVLPHGTPAQVRAEVRRRLDLFADGGLIFGPSHQIQPDAPTANILAMYEAAGGIR